MEDDTRCRRRSRETPGESLGGLDPLGQAAAGLEYEAGPVYEGNTPLWYRWGRGDTSNALASVVGVLMALYHRKKTGEGEALWTSLLNATAVGDPAPTPTPTASPLRCPGSTSYRRASAPFTASTRPRVAGSRWRPSSLSTGRRSVRSSGAPTSSMTPGSPLQPTGLSTGRPSRARSSRSSGTQRRCSGAAGWTRQVFRARSRWTRSTARRISSTRS